MKTQRRFSFTSIVLVILSVLQYGCPSTDPKDYPPYIKIQSPDNVEEIIRGTQVTIEVYSYDENGYVKNIDLKIHNQLVTQFGPNSSSGNIYSYIWNTTDLVIDDFYEIYAKATDNDDLTSTFTIHVQIIEGQIENTPPVASFTINPTSGSIDTTFRFDASDSHDNEDPTDSLQVRWDWNGDGVWDTQYSTEKTSNHQYSLDSTYNVKLEVKDSGGLTDIDSLFVVVDDGGWNPGEPCPGVPPVTYENRVYNPIQIGDQCWLKENLNVGIMINGNDDMSDNGTIEKYCYGNVLAYCEQSGGLYKWDEMMQYVSTEGTQGICPPGWHIPSDEEWKQLEAAVDNQYGYPDPQWDGIEFRGYNCGFNIKTTGGWANNGNGSDLFGFSVSPSGYKGLNGFYYITESAGYWTSSEAISTKAWFRQLHHYSDAIWRNNTIKDAGFSVRCIQD